VGLRRNRPRHLHARPVDAAVSDDRNSSEVSEHGVRPGESDATRALSMALWVLLIALCGGAIYLIVVAYDFIVELQGVGR
jgi:hypothetical protein